MHDRFIINIETIGYESLSPSRGGVWILFIMEKDAVDDVLSRCFEALEESRNRIRELVNRIQLNFEQSHPGQ